MTDEEKFVKIRQDLCKLLINMEESPKRNNILLQLKKILSTFNE